MSVYSRRDFLRIGAALAAGLGLGHGQAAVLAQGLERIVRQQKRVLWLQGLSCSGCSVSLLNSEGPGPLDILTELITLVFHPTLSAAQGEEVLRIIERVTQGQDYYLVLEGAVPAGMPGACMIGGRPLMSLLPEVVGRAQAIIAAGTCASFGGIPAAEGNATQATSLMEYMSNSGLPIQGRLVNCPGCPVHPQSLVASLAYLAGKGYPEVDPVLLTPNMIYKHSVHDECPRFHYWQKQVFAQRFGDEGCLFELGCLGPLSYTDCPRRQWNGGVNWCIRAGAPCTACTSENFAKRRSFPFYRKGEKHHALDYREDERKGQPA